MHVYDTFMRACAWHELVAFTGNPTEIAFAIAYETAHIVLGDHALGAVVFRSRLEREVRPDAFAAATIACARHDPFLEVALLERMGEGVRSQHLGAGVSGSSGRLPGAPSRP